MRLVSGEHHRAVEARGRHMDQIANLDWMQQLQRVGVALVIGFVPALVAQWKYRPVTPWYLYGFVCALFAWPAVALPTIHALLVRPHGKPEQISQQRRRESALALLKEEGVRSYPSWIAELRGKSPAGMELRRYAYEHLEPGEALVLFREHAEPGDKHAVSYRHRDVHLGYVPKRHRWIADAIDDGLRLLAIVETVKTGWFFRRRARSVRTRIVVLHDGR
jgi:HIRAN domain